MGRVLSQADGAGGESVRVIAFKNCPATIPIFPSITLWLFMDRLHAAQWVQGVVWSLFGIFAAARIIMAFRQKEVDIFEETQANPSWRRSA